MYHRTLNKFSRALTVFMNLLNELRHLKVTEVCYYLLKQKAVLSVTQYYLLKQEAVLSVTQEISTKRHWQSAVVFLLFCHGYQGNYFNSLYMQLYNTMLWLCNIGTTYNYKMRWCYQGIIHDVVTVLDGVTKELYMMLLQCQMVLPRNYT